MKKAIIVLTILTIVLSNLSVYAAPKNNVLASNTVSEFMESIKEDSGPIIKRPEVSVFSTTSNTILVSGSGNAKEKVILELYYKNGKGNYVSEEEPVEITLGALGVFSKEIKIPEDASKEFFLSVKLYRNSKWIYDGRIIRFTDKEDLKRALQNINNSVIQ